MPNDKPDDHTYFKQARLIRPWNSGLNRRDFIKQASVATLVASIMVAKPPMADTNEKQTSLIFTQQTDQVIQAVQLQLFPDDGDGPSANDLQALQYLKWALEDPDNIKDGDKNFILKGVGWLEQHANKSHKKSFIELTSKQQNAVLRYISKSEAGQNWLSLLLYYLIESLTLDPVYGGNPDGIGWHWLEHQPGFPAPSVDKTYRYFQQKSV